MGYFDQIAERYDRASLAWPWSWLRERECAALLDVSKGTYRGKALDLGSGAGYYTRVLLQMGAVHVTAVDASENMIAALGNNARVRGVVSKAEAIDLTSRFQYIVCAGLLEFVTDPFLVLKVARRHADNGCLMTVLVPRVNLWGKCYKFFHKRHKLKITLFQPNDIKALAEKAGWTVDDERWVWPFTYVLSVTPRQWLLTSFSSLMDWGSVIQPAVTL